MANISDLMGGEDRQILSTGNSELDKKIADGLPLESLTLIEGENDTGKSVLTQQIIWGAMKQGFSVDLYVQANKSVATKNNPSSPRRLSGGNSLALPRLAVP